LPSVSIILYDKNFLVLPYGITWRTINIP